MELTLEAVALFALKLVHETDDGSPLLRVMACSSRSVATPISSFFQGDLFMWSIAWSPTSICRNPRC